MPLRRLVPALVVLAAACGGGSSVAPVPPTPTLPGPSASPAATAIPTLTFVPRAQDYAVGHPTMPDLRISFNTALVSLTPGATVGEVNALLQQQSATIVGGVRGSATGAGGLLALRLPTTSHAAMLQALAALTAAGVVRTAVADAELKYTATTPTGADSVAWRWTDGDYPGDPNLGTWPLAAMRVPQLWNLNAQVRAAQTTVRVGILDGGFDLNAEDLNRVTVAHGTNLVLEHGNQVASIIGAEAGNGLGIDGVNPFARMTATTSPAIDTAASTTVGGVTWGLVELMTAEPALRVVNISLGYDWTTANSPVTDTASRSFVRKGGEFVFDALVALEATQALPYIVSAAGNNAIPAILGSPFNSAALDTTFAHLPHAAILVVEADRVSRGITEATFARASFSNFGGHLRAPGEQVPTALTTRSAYALDDGTSFAAPYVTGIISYLLAVEPSLPAPTKSTNVLKDLLLRTANRSPSRGGGPQPDAFAAAMSLDSITGTDRVLRRLLDVDDGTLDGNSRIDPFTQAPTLVNDVTANTTIDMADFRRWRDLMASIEFDLNVVLDGAAEHPKKDVNGDGLFETIDRENIFPQADFNGDGQLSLSARAVVPGLSRTRGPLTDLQVLQTLFTDPDYSTADLDLLTASGDVHLSPAACSITAGQSVRMRITSASGTFTRTHQFRAGETRYVLTVPVTGVPSSAYLVTSARLDAAGIVLSTLDTTVNVRIGDDVPVGIACGTSAPTLQTLFYAGPAVTAFKNSVAVNTTCPRMGITFQRDGLTLLNMQQDGSRSDPSLSCSETFDLGVPQIRLPFSAVLADSTFSGRSASVTAARLRRWSGRLDNGNMSLLYEELVTFPNTTVVDSTRPPISRLTFTGTRVP